MKAFVIAEHADMARELLTGARGMAEDVSVVSFGSAFEGIPDKNYVVSIPEGRIADDAADTLVSLFSQEAPVIVLAEASRRVKVIIGKLAASVGCAVITDVLSFNDGVANSLYFGGVGERMRKPLGSTSFFTVGHGVFEEAEVAASGEVVVLDWVEPKNPVKLVSSSPVEKTGVDLTKANVVVSVGRGFAEESDLDLARALCEKLGAGMACSRPLTEGVNWLPSETYVGVSGLMLSPDVYLAVGISGQMQHMVGCNRSGKLFAINKDKNAPIFKQCDYGLVGDLKTVLPELTAAL